MDTLVETESTSGVKTLERNPIKPGAEAIQRFKEWNIPDELIATLTDEILPQFDYDNCVSKIARVASREILLATKEQNETAFLPFFFAIKARKDGQCGDLAVQLMVDGHFQNWLEDVNEAIGEAGNPLVSVHCYGNSKTHFNHPDSNHAYVGVMRMGDSLDDMVVVDPSFQVIQSVSESGYVTRAQTINPREFKHSLTGEITLGKYKKKNWKGETIVQSMDGLTLGISHDGRVAYELNLLINADDKSIMPSICVQYADGITFDEFYLDPDTKTLTTTGKNFDAVQGLEEEIEKMLQIAASFRYTTDRGTFPIPLTSDLEDQEARIILR